MRIALLIYLSLTISLTACAHRTVIHTTEPDTYVHVDGRELGRAPVVFDETSGFGKEYMFAVTKEGYKPYYLTVTQSSVNPSAKLGSYLSAVPIGGAAYGLTTCGVNPIAAAVAGTIAVVLVSLQVYHLPDYYMLPVGEPGSEPLSPAFMERRPKEKPKLSAYAQPVTH